MAKPGRKPLPAKTLKLRNSTAQYKPNHRGNEPDAPKGKPSCPQFLSAEGKREWTRATGHLQNMGILSPADRAILVGLCQNWAIFVRASTALNGFDEFDGSVEQARVATLASDSFKNYSRACAAFGLTPSDRSRVNLEDKQKTEDKFDTFLNRKGRKSG